MKPCLLEISDEMETKKAAILRFKTQTTSFSEQQPRTILINEFL